MTAVLVLACGLTCGLVVVVCKLVGAAVVSPVEPAPRVETWLSAPVEPLVEALALVEALVTGEEVELWLVVPDVVGAAAWLVVVGLPPPPPLTIRGTTTAAATMTAPTRAASMTRGRPRRGFVPTTSWDV